MHRYSWEKNNPEGRYKPAGLPCVTGCAGDVKQDAMGKWIKPCVLCPAHLGWHAKALQKPPQPRLSTAKEYSGLPMRRGPVNIFSL